MMLAPWRQAVSEHSDIEWCDATWNPVRGCTLISPGCAHCYAQTFAERFRGVKGHPYEQGFDLRLVPEKLAEPLRWMTPKMIFVNSMSDLFHKDVPEEYVEAVCRTMERANWHTYQVLTKRSSRMRNMLQTKLDETWTGRNTTVCRVAWNSQFWTHHVDWLRSRRLRDCILPMRWTENQASSWDSRSNGQPR